MTNIKTLLNGISSTNRIVRRSICTSRTLEGSSKVNLFGLNFDRREKINHEESIKYLNSETYKKIYKGQLVWQSFRRNNKSQFPTDRTRPNCINQEGFLDTSYPCPICRDEYLVIHPENVKLLEQFVDPYTDLILTPRVHSLCQKQYRNLIIAITQARDRGLLTMEIPERLYNYDDFYAGLRNESVSKTC